MTKAGRAFTDSEVTGWLIVLLFAGQHTSSITSTWLGAMLLDNPEVRPTPAQTLTLTRTQTLTRTRTLT